MKKKYKKGDKVIVMSIPPGENLYSAIILGSGTVFDYKIKKYIKGEWVEGEINESEITSHKKMGG